MKLLAHGTSFIIGTHPTLGACYRVEVGMIRLRVDVWLQSPPSSQGGNGHLGGILGKHIHIAGM